MGGGLTLFNSKHYLHKVTVLISLYKPRVLGKGTKQVKKKTFLFTVVCKETPYFMINTETFYYEP